MKSIVSEKGQVTIPKRLRERLGIRPGQVLDFVEEQGRLLPDRCSFNDPGRKTADPRPWLLPTLFRKTSGIRSERLALDAKVRSRFSVITVYSTPHWLRSTSQNGEVRP